MIQGKYLTAETFQSKVTCNGNTMKKKQIWLLEGQSGNDIALKSTSTNKYLTSDRDGKLDCSGEEVGFDQTFSVEVQEDGQVAIKNAHGRYIGGTGDHMTGFDQYIGPTNCFSIHLAIHPQVNIHNINRRRYIHYDDTTEELACTELIPWGYDATIILEFHDGKYALRAANTSYLSQNGDLVEVPTQECLFTLVFHKSYIAFRCLNGKYLTAVGASGKIESRKSVISKDELFELTDSKPQVQLVASNGKLVSTREGIEVRAKQTEVTDKEIFQMEPASTTDFSGNVQWSFRSDNNKVWDSGVGSSVTNNAPSASAESTFFTIEWMGTQIVLKASNGKYIFVKPNGQMSATATEINENCKFTFHFVNRPILVLRGEYGFVGVKGNSGRLECNRSQYDVFMMKTDGNGTYHFKGANGKYFKIEDETSAVSILGESPTDFFLELRAESRMVIVAPGGKFLRGQQNGVFAATGADISKETLWEY